MSRLRGAEAAARGFASTRSAESLQAYQGTRAESEQAVGRLRELSAGIPRRQEELKRLLPLATNTMQVLDQMVEVRQQPATPQPSKEAQPPPAELISETSKVIGETQGEEAGLLKQQEADAARSVRKATTLTVAADALAVWCVALGALLLYRSAAERKFTGLERRMHARLLDVLPVGVCLADDTGLVFYTNPAQDALFGYPPGELIGRHIRILTGASPEEGDRIAEEILQKLSGGGTWQGETTGRKRSGETFRSFTRASSMELPGKIYRVFVQEEIR